MEQLIQWLNEQCEEGNMTWREASLKAGLNPGAISAIMNGQRPGLETCKALAKLFDVPVEFVLRIAGHLPPHPDHADLAPTAQAELEEIERIVRGLPEDLQDEFAREILAMAKAMERIHRSVREPEKLA